MEVAIITILADVNYFPLSRFALYCYCKFSVFNQWFIFWILL